MTFSGSKFPATDNRDSREQYLRFYLYPDTTAMLPVARLTEVLTIPVGQIVPIPHLPSWVMGVYNWRGDILWMVDLGQLLGLTPWYQKAINVTNHRAIVLHSDVSGKRDRGPAIGLVIDRVEDIEYCDTERIQSPPPSMVTMNLAPFLRGYWMKGNGDMILTLDGPAILAAMPRG